MGVASLSSNHACKSHAIFFHFFACSFPVIILCSKMITSSNRRASDKDAPSGWNRCRNTPARTGECTGEHTGERTVGRTGECTGERIVGRTGEHTVGRTGARTLPQSVGHSDRCRAPSTQSLSVLTLLPHPTLMHQPAQLTLWSPRRFLVGR